MDARVVNRGRNDRTARKPLQDTTTSTNNYNTSPAPVRHQKAPNCGHTKDVRPQHRYDNGSEQAENSNPQSRIASPGIRHCDLQSAAPTAAPTTPVQKPMKLRKGKARVGPWVLGRTLGKGSSGRVRLAKHIETGQLAAIKIVGKDQQENSSPYMGQIGDPVPSGLEREVVIMKLIDHPNVMGLWDVWENRGELYLVLEYIEGGELFERLTTHGRLPEKEAMKYFRQIMSGLDYCQHFNICHRDLKPENLLLDAKNNIKIADFGMAALQPKGSLLSTPCGSPHYASPEIVAGKRYDGSKSDIWSCGVVLYALLAGFLPFDGEDLKELLQKVMLGRFNMPQDFSIEAQDLIWRMLTVDPKARITMEQVWRHPLVRRHAPIDPRTGLETDRGPKPPSSRDIGRPVNTKGDIDREILKNLRTLWQGAREKDLVERLLSNVYNQEKVFYYLLMKYRYEHLENYPGSGLAPEFHQKSKTTLQRKPSSRSVTGPSHQRANSITFRNHQHHRKRSSLVSQDGHRPQIKGKGLAIESKNLASDGRRSRFSHTHPQADSTEEGLQCQQPRPQLRAIASRSFLDSSARYGSRSGGKRRQRSRSSLVSYVSSSPSGYRSVRPSHSYKRHISFKHHKSRHIAGGRSKLTVRNNNTDEEIWVDDRYREDPNRGGSPEFDPEVLMPPKGRKESINIVKRRSAVVIDGHVLESDYTATAPPMWKKMAALPENEDAERRRIVSKELEEVCEKAFNSSAMRSSFGTLSTVKSIGDTTKESIKTVDTNTFLDEISSTLEHPTSQTFYTDSQDSAEGTLPSASPARKRSNGRNTLRTLGDKNDREKGCLDDVIEHLDRLMGSSSKLRSIEHLRAVSQGGVPLSLGGAPIISGDAPAMVRQYLDQEERVNQQYLTAHVNLRNVSAPNPQGVPTIGHRGRQGKQLVHSDKALQPAPLRLRPKSVLRSLEGGTPRSETRNTVDDVNEVLHFDAPMPTPELKLPTGQNKVQNGVFGVTSHADCDAILVVASEFLTTNSGSQPKKKRSFMDIITGRKVSKADKLKAKAELEISHKVSGAQNTLDNFTNHSVDFLNTEKETFGRRSGNALLRLVSRDAKKELDDTKKEWGLINMPSNSTPDGVNALAACFSPTGCMSDEETSPALGNQNEFARVMGQRNWFQRILNVKPASRVIYFNISAFQCRKAILKLYKDWTKHGLVIVEDDRRGLVLRARVCNPNTLNIKEVTFVGEIRTSSGTKKNGTSVVQFTQERGAASSFNRVVDEISLACSLNGLIAQGEYY